MTRAPFLTAALAAASISSAALAQDDSPDSIKAEIDALQRRLAALEAREQAAAAAGAVQADAERRSQPVPGLAGYDKGFKIQSADGRFSLAPGLLAQFRNVTNFNDAEQGDSVENGFEIRRLRVRLDGNAFSKNLKYGFMWDAARNSGNTTLLDAWVAYNFEGTPYVLKAGQFRNTWVHEGDVADARQLAVERSLVDATFGGTVTDRVQGVELSYGYPSPDSSIRAAIGLHDGANSKNTDFRDSDGPDGRNDANFGLSSRVEYKVFGKWANYSDFTAKSANEDLLIFGAGTDFTQGGDQNILRLTADGQYENTLGISAYAALSYVNTDGADASADNFGGLLQAGYLVNPNLEPFARYGIVLLDDEFSGEDTFHELSVGVNYYFGERGFTFHNVKFTLDLNYLPNGVPLANSAATGLGYLAGTDDQFALRAQLQVSF